MHTPFTDGILPIIGQSGAATLAAIRTPSWMPESLNQWVFESHWVYSLGLLAAAVLLYFFGRAALGKLARRLASLLAFVALLWIALPFFFVTPSVRLQAAHERILQAASAGQSAPIKDLLADDFRFGPANKLVMSLSIDAALPTLKPKTNLERFYAATLRGSEADTQINILTTLDAGATIPPGPYLTKWKLQWRDVPGQDWKLVAISHWYTSDGTNDTEMPYEIPALH